MKVTSTEFQQNIRRYLDLALREPITITKHGRDHAVLLSADFLKIVLADRLARRVEDLDDGTINTIAEAEVPREQPHLDTLTND